MISAVVLFRDLFVASFCGCSPFGGPSSVNGSILCMGSITSSCLVPPRLLRWAGFMVAILVILVCALLLT